jgi:CRISPR-associated protein Csh2
MQPKNRSEILFCYDIKDNNPNGDPLDGNKPRIDEATDRNIVTDVRLKRTVRDYLRDFKGQVILIEAAKDEASDETGSVKTGKQRAMDFFRNPIDGTQLSASDMKKDLAKASAIVQGNVLKKCIDARLFGCTLPLGVEGDSSGASSITLTGPVQFRMGRSLNKVELVRIKGTGAFASKAGADQNTFREEYILPYSFIAFYGLVNENAAADTELTTDDLDALYDALWNGTKNLISRSKIGQVPRFLLVVTFKDENYHIGDLDKAIAMTPIPGTKEEQVRDVTDFVLDVTDLLVLLSHHVKSIQQVALRTDERLRFVASGSPLKAGLDVALKALDLSVVKLGDS